MDQFGVVCARGGSKVVAFDKRDLQAPEACIASNASARDSAANDKQVEVFVSQPGEIAAHEKPRGGPRKLRSTVRLVKCSAEPSGSRCERARRTPCRQARLRNHEAVCCRARRQAKKRA